MKTIAVINQKGGVGKTTTTVAIGTELRRRGYRVLFIDLDAQMNLTSLFFKPTRNKETREFERPAYLDSRYVVLKEPERITEEIVKTDMGDIVPSSKFFVGLDAIITEDGKEYRLKKALRIVSNDYDYCLIDTPPTLGIITINALTGCNGVIIPSLADLFGLQGISQLNETIRDVRKYSNPDLYVMGIVITRHKNTVIGRILSRDLDYKMKDAGAKLYKTKIRENISITEALMNRQPIFEYAPSSNGAKDYAKLVDEILEDEEMTTNV